MTASKPASSASTAIRTRAGRSRGSTIVQFSLRIRISRGAVIVRIGLRRTGREPRRSVDTARSSVRRTVASWSCSASVSAEATAVSSRLNRGNSSPIFSRPSAVRDTSTVRPSRGSRARATQPRPSSVRRTPVAVGRLMPTSSAKACASSSPQTQSTQSPTNDVQESRSGARTLASRCRRIAAELRNTFEIAHIARKSSGMWPSCSSTFRSAGRRPSPLMRTSRRCARPAPARRP